MKMRGKGFLVWSPPAAAAKKEIIKIRYISAAAEEITTRTNYKSYKREFPFLKIKKNYLIVFFFPSQTGALSTAPLNGQFEGPLHPRLFLLRGCKRYIHYFGTDGRRGCRWETAGRRAPKKNLRLFGPGNYIIENGVPVDLLPRKGRRGFKSNFLQKEKKGRREETGTNQRGHALTHLPERSSSSRQYSTHSLIIKKKGKEGGQDSIWWTSSRRPGPLSHSARRAAGHFPSSTWYTHKKKKKKKKKKGNQVEIEQRRQLFSSYLFSSPSFPYLLYDYWSRPSITHELD